MHCIRSESRSVRVYDKEYKAVEDEDSGGVSKSILEGARQITLSHDSYFYIESSKRQEVRVSKMSNMLTFIFVLAFLEIVEASDSEGKR